MIRLQMSKDAGMIVLMKKKKRNPDSNNWADLMHEKENC
jgi:hypothetical protein